MLTYLALLDVELVAHIFVLCPLVNLEKPGSIFETFEVVVLTYHIEMKSQPVRRLSLRWVFADG